MPGGDRTGPAGFGPMTGRAAGYCAGFGMPGFANPMGGRGFWGRGGGGWGRGGGRGWRNMYYATGLPGWARGGWAPYGGAGFAGAPWGGYASPGYPQYGYGAGTSRQEMDDLKAQAEYLEDALDGIRKRMEELEAKAKKD